MICGGGVVLEEEGKGKKDKRMVELREGRERKNIREAEKERRGAL